jgi:hypothetical protein
MSDEKIRAILMGGIADGLELELLAGSARLLIPFLCGAGICWACYVPAGFSADGEPRFNFKCEEHRSFERELTFLSPMWKAGLCRRYAASPAGKRFIEQMEAIGR